MSLDVAGFSVAPDNVSPPLIEKCDKLVEAADSGASKVRVTSVRAAEPTAFKTFGGVRDPESGRALKSASVRALLVLRTNRSMNIPASRVPIFKVNGVPAFNSSWVTV